jgi:UDP-3-O-[3-hydroxymyristoyl] glucosamine N-acyltransferase
MPRYTVADLLHHVGEHRLVGDAEGKWFEGTAAITAAGPHDLVWVRPSHPERQTLAAQTQATIVICGPELELDRLDANKTFIVVANPKVAFSRAVNALLVPRPAVGVHPSANVHREARIGRDVSIGAGAFVGQATIGDGCILHPNCFVYDNVSLGRDVIVHAGAVVGAEGFGYERDESGNVFKFPHLGSVVIEDDVEIGGCTVIDRGSLQDTVVRRGAKIDNLVHVAHNVDIGEGAFVVAAAMLGGSVKVGRNVWVGPGAVVRDNLTIGDDAFIGIGALIVKDVPSGETHMGSPARPMEEYKALLAATKRLAAG